MNGILGRRVPLWSLVVLALIAGVVVVAVVTAADAGDDDEALGEEERPATCVEVLAAADAFVDAGEGNGEIFVARDPDTGGWAVGLSPDEERCGLRYREVIDRLAGPSSPTADDSDEPAL